MTTTTFSFKEEKTFEQRASDARRIMLKYPDRIPVICEKSPTSDLEDIDKKKFLVPDNLTVGQFIFVIRKRIKLRPERALFIFVDGILPSTSDLMGGVFKDHKDKDGFLYVTYASESTFGNLPLED